MLSLGAAVIWGTIGDAAAALVPAVKRGGFVAIGEPYRRQWPPLTASTTEALSTERHGEAVLRGPVLPRPD